MAPILPHPARTVTQVGDDKVMPVWIESFPAGPWQANCYLVGADGRGDAVVIDPGVDAAGPVREEIISALEMREPNVFVRDFDRPNIHLAVERFEDAGVAAIIFTDIARDGLLKGLNLDATIELAERISIPVIASGGVGTLDHLVEGVTGGHASAVLAASIFHFGTFTIAQAKVHMAAAGIPMRLT